uniref:Uncharacterized protein n=1 Tax=Anopheles farauti TaxID=69004 RepID=A0A182QJZ1_9DIPT
MHMLRGSVDSTRYRRDLVCIAAVVMIGLAAVAEAGLAPLLYGAAPLAPAPLALAAPHTTILQSNAEPKLIASAPAFAYAPAPLTYAAAAAPTSTRGTYGQYDWCDKLPANDPKSFHLPPDHELHVPNEPLAPVDPTDGNDLYDTNQYHRNGRRIPVQQLHQIHAALCERENHCCCAISCSFCTEKATHLLTLVTQGSDIKKRRKHVPAVISSFLDRTAGNTSSTDETIASICTN